MQPTTETLNKSLLVRQAADSTLLDLALSYKIKLWKRGFWQRIPAERLLRPFWTAPVRGILLKYRLLTKRAINTPVRSESRLEWPVSLEKYQYQERTIMGWLIVGLFLMLILTLIQLYDSRRNKLGRHRVADVDIYDRVEHACLHSGDRQGEFDIDLAEVSDLSWLELGSHEFSPDQFRATVKWRNQGTQCIYKLVATAGEGEASVTKHSKKNIIPLKS